MCKMIIIPPLRLLTVKHIMMKKSAIPCLERTLIERTPTPLIAIGIKSKEVPP